MPWKTVGLTRLGVKLTSMVQPQQDRHILEGSRVRQGCVLAPALFCVAIDWILNHMDANPGIRVYLVYADDTTETTRV